MAKKAEKRRKSLKPHISVAWYKPEQWDKLLDISADAGQLEKTYEQWKVYAEQALKDLANRQVFPVKVTVDIDDLESWCNTRNLPINGDSRSRYAAWLLKNQAEGESA